MLTIHITDLPANEGKTETFLDGDIKVLSHSGLHPTEALLFENLPRLTSVPAKLLVAGNRTGAIALAATARFPGCAMTCHAFDVHHARAIGRNLSANGAAPAFVYDPFVSGPTSLLSPQPDVSRSPSSETQAPLPGRHPAITVACTASLPQGPYDAVLFMATPGTMTGELILDQLEDLHQNLVEGGICILACEAESRLLFKQIRALFGNISIRFDKNGIFCVIARKQAPLTCRRDFSAAFPASLPGGERWTLVSLPGVFCHRRPDAGGLALAEIAARELTPGRQVLDMGCGCGLVGLLLSKSQPDTRVTFIDSHARALAATYRNLTALGIRQAELFLSDEGIAKTGVHLFAGNPPYYSDFRIADLFLQTAYDTLLPGGSCLMVAKAVHALHERQSTLFGHAEIMSRRGYGVVKSIR